MARYQKERMKHIAYMVALTLLGWGIYAIESWEMKDANTNIRGVQEVQGEGELKLTFLDIGQGDATYVEFHDGTDMLIDCAIDGRILEALGRVMEWNDRTLDYLIVTHPDLDHYGGCEEVLTRFDVGTIVYNGLKKEDSKLWQSFDRAVRAEGAEYLEIGQYDVWEIASTTITFLYPDHEIAVDTKVPGRATDTGANDTSIVMTLRHGPTSIALMGDAEDPLEAYLAETYGEELDVDILKLGHHGSDSSSSEEFLGLVSPQDAIVSAGKENKYGHPSLRVLKRVERASSTLWRTDAQGDIRVIIGDAGYEIKYGK
jgi:competence protein ComEC